MWLSGLHTGFRLDGELIFDSALSLGVLKCPSHYSPQNGSAACPRDPPACGFSLCLLSDTFIEWVLCAGCGAQGILCMITVNPTSSLAWEMRMDEDVL